MMAPLKMIVAIAVAVAAAVVLEVEATGNMYDLVNSLADKMESKWFFKYNDPEKIYLFAKEHFSGVAQSDFEMGEIFLKAWDRVLHNPDLCDDLSLQYINTVTLGDITRPSLITLKEAGEKYARKCLTPAYLANKIESRLSFYSGGSRELELKDVAEFVDDKFIADYFAEHPDNSPLQEGSWRKAVKAMAKAIIRDRENNIGNLENVTLVHDYLEERFYKPCYLYWFAMTKVEVMIYQATEEFLEGGYNKVISSLDDHNAHALLRTEVCNDDRLVLDTAAGRKALDSEKHTTSAEVVSELKSIKTAEQAIVLV